VEKQRITLLYIIELDRVIRLLVGIAIRPLSMLELSQKRRKKFKKNPLEKSLINIQYENI